MYSNSINSIGDFDYSKIIVDPSKLVKGKKYYVGDTVISLLKKIRNNEAQIFGNAETIDEERIQLGFTDSGLWYSLWYPVEEKYKPYENPDLAWLDKIIIEKKTLKKYYINGIGSEVVGIVKTTENLIIPSLYLTFKRLLELFTWEDGTACGEIEKR